MTHPDMKGGLLGDHEDWTKLIGQQVHIRKDGLTLRSGKVETVADSGETMWIAAHGVEQRALYDKAQGYRAVPLSKEAGGQ
jgi:hypothetical protein